MNNPGSFPLLSSALSSFSIGAAQTQVGQPQQNLQGMQAVTFQARFQYGAGGTNVTAYLQTTFDQGNTWCDIAAIQFTTANGASVVNLSGMQPLTTPATPTDGSLTAGTVVDGPLGDQLRVKVISTGTYTGQSLLSAWAVAR
jgi:hypothetical protein